MNTRLDITASQRPGLRLPLLRLAGWGMSIVLGTALIAGIVARLAGLGGRPLALDEYYFVQSVGFALEHGVPAFPSGGYYTRGLLLQYLTAGAVLLFGETGFAFRLPATIFSFISIALSYIYCRRHMDGPLAVAIAIALLVSSWHIEFARFARMYAPFQCFALLYLIAIDEAYFRGRRQFRYAPHMALAGAGLTHALSIFLVPLLCVPFFVKQMRAHLGSPAVMVRFGIVTLVVGLGVVGLAMFDFRGLGVQGQLPIDYVNPSAVSPVSIPALPFWSLGGSDLTSFAAVLAILALTGGTVYLLRRKQPAPGRDVALVGVAVSSLLHQFMIAALLTWGLIGRFQIHRIGRHPKRCYLALAVAAVAFAVWLAVALGDRSWVAEVDGAETGLVWSLRRAFFGWPDFYRQTLLPWTNDLPWIGLMALFSLAYMSLRTIGEPAVALLRRPWVSVAFILLCFGVVRSEYAEIRYWYFMYPIVLCMIAGALQDIAQQLRLRSAGTPMLAAGAFLALFALSGDFRPSHIANIAGRDVAFRTGAFTDLDRIWYSRYDFRTPATFVNRRVGSGAAARGIHVVVADPSAASYYLDVDHVIYHDRTHGSFPLISRDRGRRELWSDRTMLNTPAGLKQFTRNAREIWLIRLSDPEKHAFTIQSLWGGGSATVRERCRSLDGRVEVIRIVAGGNPAPAPVRQWSCASASTP